MGTLHPVTFAALLRRFRRATGMTQAELAERAGLSPEAISALERGVNRAPRRETVDLLGDALSLEEQERSQFEQSARRRPVLASPPVAPPPPPALVPFTGRTHEVELIERLLGDRFPPVLLFAGEPGVGKTRLLRVAAARANDSGWLVLMEGCRQASFHDPYAPLLSMLERDVAARADDDLKAALQGCGWLVRLLPELAERHAFQLPTWTLAPEQERRLMFAAVARYLSNIAGAAGTLLVLDDLQWAGSDACDLVATLARAPSATPLRIVGGYRNTELPADHPLAAAIGDLEHEGLLYQRDVGRLTADECATLLQELLANSESNAVNPQMRQRVLRQSGGIPFYLVSWAQALVSGALAADEADTLPADVMQSIRRRISAQSDLARMVMHVLAVAGGNASLRLLREVLHPSGRTEDEVIAAIESDTQARLLDEVGEDTYQFAHDAIREVVAHDLSAARRTALHRRIAEALEREPGEPPIEALAFHYLRGDESVKALAYLERSGDRAVAMQAYSAAEAAYSELVARLDHLGRSRDAAYAREKWGETLRLTARYDQALSAFEHARDLHHADGDAEAEARVLAQIGQVHADRGSAREGLRRLARARSAEASQGVAPRTLAALHDVYAQLLHIGGQYREQLAETEWAATYARDAGDDLLLCQIQMRQGSALRMLGQLREASRTLEDVIAVAEAIGDPRILSQALENVSVVYLLQGEFERSTRYVERALTLVEQLSDPLATELLVLRRGLNAYAAGDWCQSQADYERARELSHQVGASWVSPYIALGSGQLRLAQGERAPGSDLLEEAVTLAEQQGDLQALRWAQTALAERDLLAGDPASAHARLQPLLDRPGQQEGLVTYLLPYLAWAALELGQADAAEEYLRECLARATGEHIRLAKVDALRVRVVQAMSQQDFAEAEQALAEGLRLSRELPYPYAEAKLLYVGGLSAHLQGDDTQARARLQRARAGLQALGEGLYLPHVEQVLAGLS